MDKYTKYTLNHKSMKQIVTVLSTSTVVSITKGSLLYASSTFVSAVACSCGVWHDSSYSSGLFSRSVLVVGGMIVHTPLVCSAGLVGSP